jgi:hypothetical protein
MWARNSVLLAYLFVLLEAGSEDSNKDTPASMSKAEKEKRLDALNQKLGITHPNELTEYGQEEMEERDWLKKKLGYAKQ